jgi:hypothetical protein
MIAEAPAPYCDLNATPVRAPPDACRSKPCTNVPSSPRDRVAFFDFDHGQTGVAPNAIELHPILGFRCLSG